MLNFRNLKYIKSSQKYVSKHLGLHSEPNYDNLSNIINQSETLLIRHANSKAN